MTASPGLLNDSYVVRRLIHCAIYHKDHGPGPRRLRSWYHPMVMEPNVKQTANPDRPMSVNATECEETYHCILALEPKLRRAIYECYFKGGTVEVKIKALGVSNSTYYNHLSRAHKEILGFLNDLAAGITVGLYR